MNSLIKLNEVPNETIVSNTLKLIGNSDNHIKQIGIDLLKEYINTSLNGQIELIKGYIGNLEDLSTTEKESLITSINEIDSKISETTMAISNLQDVVQKNETAIRSVDAELSAEKITDYFKNNTIYATFEINGDFQQYDYVTIGQVKQKYAPKIKTNGICIISNGASVTKALIANDGSLLVYPKKLISTVLECHFVYSLD